MPEPVGPGQKRRKGRSRLSGKERISLAKRAGQKRGRQRAECERYGREVTKTLETFQATWEPAGGVIRVVLELGEDGEWLPFSSTDPEATAVKILEGMADRGSHEQMSEDVKEVWSAGQLQVRNA